MARSVTKLRREAKEAETEIWYLHSPLSKNWSINWIGDPVVIHPGVNKLTKQVYQHIEKHMVDAVMNERGYKQLDHEKRREIKKMLRADV